MANGRYVAELSVETGKLESGVNKAKAALDDLQKKGDMKKLQSSIKNLTGLMDNFTSKIGISTSALSQLATPLGAIGLIGGAIAGIGVASVKAAADLETLDTNLGTLLGSMDKGVTLRKELQQYGQSTPYDTEGLANAAKTMLGYGVASERIMPVMKQLGDIAMGNKDHLNALALAYGQMTASGKVMKQDLNQMANAGFGVNQIAASMGVSVGKFFNLLSDGKVKIEDINKALNDATSAGGLFYHSAINSSSTFEGVMSNLGEAAKNTLANIGTSLLPAVKDAAQGLVQVFEFLSTAVQALTSPSENLNNTFGSFGGTIALVRDALSTLFESIGNLYDAVVQVFTEMFAGSGIMQSFGEMVLTAAKYVVEFVSTIINFTANLIRAAASTEDFKNHLKTFKNIIDILTSTWNILVKAFKLGVHYISGVGGSLNDLKNYFTALTGPINWVISRFRLLIDVLKVSMSLINKVLDKKMKEEGIGEKKKTPKKEEKKPSPVITPKPVIKDDGGDEKKKKKKKKKGKHIKTSAEKIKEAEVKFANDTKEIQNKHKTGYYDNIGDELKDKVKAYDSLIEVYSAEGKAITSLKQKRNALNAQLQAYIKKVNDAKKAEDEATKSAEDAIKKREEAVKKANEDSAKALNSDNFGKKTKSEQITDNQDDSDKEKNHLSDKIQAIKSQMDELEKVMNEKKDLHLDFSQEEKALDNLSDKLKQTLKEFKKLEDGRKNIDDFKSALDSFQGQDFQSFKALLKNLKKIAKMVSDPKEQVEEFGRELTGVEKGGMLAGSGLEAMGQGLASIAQGGDAAKAAAIMTAIGQLVLGFATASAEAAKEMGPLPWIAFTIAGLATLATTIATVSGYANGGIIGGNGTPSGDMGLIRANVGEMVLNKNQQSHLFEMLDKGNVGGGNVTSTVRVKGADLYLALNNFSKIKGKSGIITGIK
ncbi:tape measure protein [Prevotella histicola]|uniref:tape measure protein n=1 Tax=Prevotella histicola TaxID=470565 RepID=UPI0028EB7500|nr:tape measure protein [Prevotella histicola]